MCVDRELHSQKIPQAYQGRIRCIRKLSEVYGLWLRKRKFTKFWRNFDVLTRLANFPALFHAYSAVPTPAYTADRAMMLESAYDTDYESGSLSEATPEEGRVPLSAAEVQAAKFTKLPLASP